MEKKWQKRRERSARIKLFFKRVRLPLLTVGGTFLTAFIIIPLALGAYEARAESIEVTASSKQAQPSAQVGDIQIATPEPVMTAEPLPTESTEGFTAPTDAPDDMQQYNVKGCENAKQLDAGTKPCAHCSSGLWIYITWAAMKQRITTAPSRGMRS